MELETRVNQIIADTMRIEKDTIKLESSFIDDLNLDSLDMVELMMKMEDEFGLEIPDEDTENLKTVQDVLTYIKTKQTH